MGTRKSKEKHKSSRKKRAFVYKSLEEKDRPSIPESDYDEDAYTYFKSIKWDAAYKEFLEIKKDGTYKYQTSWALAKYIAQDDKIKSKWVYAAIGPRDKKEKHPIVPHIGDWAYIRSSLFIGETSKE